MLIKEVLHEYDGRVKMVNENYGQSRLAEQFGIVRYPAVFVDDILVAKPKDFGFYGKQGAQGSGRYTPWRDAASHERFKQDLKRMIDLVLAGRMQQARALQSDAPVPGEVGALPDFSLTDLEGNRLTNTDFEGRVVIVEFWATWCPPCRSTLGWLKQVEDRNGGRVAVLALAVESREAEVRNMVSEATLPAQVALAAPEVAVAFGDVVSVPTMLVFGADGKTAAVFYGAPGDLHEKTSRLLATLLEASEM